MMEGYYRDNTAHTAIKEVGQVRTDCFGYKREQWLDSVYENCTVLRKLYCKKEKCNFYKSEEEFRKGCYNEGIY
jgi:hypothetical protein